MTVWTLHREPDSHNAQQKNFCELSFPAPYYSPAPDLEHYRALDLRPKKGCRRANFPTPVY